MEVMHHQPNGTRKGHRQVRPPSQGSTNESASDVEQQLNTRGEGSHIALPFANSTTSHYVPDSDDSDTESRPMLINTEGKEEAEVDKLEDEDMDAEKANYDASEEAPADQDAASESENHTSSSALSGGNIEKFAGERQPETSELPMDTTVSADKEDIHKDPMSPEIQVVSSGQAFKPTLSSVSGVQVSGAPVLSPAASLPFATWSAWQSRMLPAFGMGSNGMPLATPTSQDLLEPGTSVTVPLTVCQESEGVLVVRLRWREKTYSGSLIDLGQHNWAPPKLSGSSSENPLALQSLYNNEGENQTVDIDDDDKEVVSPAASTSADAQPSTVTDMSTSLAPCEGADAAIQSSSSIATTPAVNQANLLKVPKPDANYSDISEDDDDLKEPSTSTLMVPTDAAPSSTSAVSKRPYNASTLGSIPSKKEDHAGVRDAMDTSTPQQKHLGKKTADGKVQSEEIASEYVPSAALKEDQPAVLHPFTHQQPPVSSVSANVGDQRRPVMPPTSSSGSTMNKNNTLSRENSLSNLATLASVASSQDTNRTEKSRSGPEGFPPSTTKDDDRDSSSTLTASPDHTTTNAPIGYSGSRQRADADRLVISETGKATVGYSMPGADTAVSARQNEGNSSDSSGSGSVAPSDRRKKSKHRQTQSREVLQRASPAPATSAGASNERSAASEGRRKLLATTVPVDHPVSPGHSQKRPSAMVTEPLPHRHERHHGHHHSSRHHAHETGTHSASHGGHSHRDTHPKDYIEHRHEGKQGSATYGSDVAPHISTLASSSSSPSTHIVSSTKTASLPVAPLSATTAHMSPNPSHESGGSPQSHPEAYRSHSKPPTGTSSSQVAPASAPGVHSSLATPAKLHRKRHSKELPHGVKKPCSPDSTGSGGMVSGRVSSSDTVDATASRMADMQGHPPHGQQLQQSMAGFVYDPSMPIPVEWQMLSYQNQQKKKTGSDGKTGTEGMSVLSGQRPPSVPGSGPKDQPHHHHRHHSQRSHTGSDSARHQVKQELDPMTHHNKHHSSSNSHSHASLHTPNAAVLTPEQQARIRSSSLMQSSSKRAEQRPPTSPSPAVIGHTATIMGSSPSGAIQVQGVHEAKESGRGESKLVDRHEASSIHRPPGRPRVRVPSHSTSATNRSPTEAKDKPQPHQAGLVAVAPPPVAGVQGMWPPEMMQYGGMLLSGYPAVGTSQASVGGAIPFSMVGAPQGVYSMSGGAWHINPSLMAYGGAMEQKPGEGSKAEHVPVVRATTTEPSKGHSTSNSRSSATASQSSSATGVQGRQEQQATPHSQGIFPFMMPGVRGGKDSPSPVPMSYLQGNSMHAYLQAQMQQQQQQQQHHQQQHATAQQQRSETSSSRPISGLPSKSTSQEKSQQQQSVVSQQQKAVEQAAAAQQPLMAPGVMTQPLAVQMAGMIPMATQEDLAKFQLEYLQRNGMQQQEMMAIQQQMLHQMQQQFQQQQQQQQPTNSAELMAMYQQLLQQQAVAAAAAAQQHHQQQQASAQQQAQQRQQQQVAAVAQLHPTAVHANQGQEFAVHGFPMQFINPVQPAAFAAAAGGYLDQSVVLRGDPSTILQRQK